MLNKDFLDEIMLFLAEEDIAELSEKAGVRFPITEARWIDLCYICCWVGVKKRLPDPIHNRMMLGEQNEWTRIYANMSAIRHPISEGIKIWDLAS